MLPQGHVKDAGRSAKSVCGRLQLHANTFDPMTQRTRSGLPVPLCRHGVGTYQEIQLTCNSSGNTRRQSSKLAEPPWTDLGLKSGISARYLISNVKKKEEKSIGRE